MSRPIKLIAKDDHDRRLVVLRTHEGPALQCGQGFVAWLTPSRARKIVAALMPFTEWTPDQNRPQRKANTERAQPRSSRGRERKGEQE